MTSPDYLMALQRPQLRQYQEAAVAAILKSFETHDSTLLVMATGLGKCLGPGTPVLRFDGRVVPVEEVRTGDLLMGPDSLPRRVLSATEGHGPMFQIQPVKGDSWTCNWCHVLTLKHTTTGEIVDVPLDEYSASNKNFKHLHKQFSVGVEFQSAEPLPLDPYIFGLWLGDGSKRLDSFTITKPDPEVPEALRGFAEHWGLEVKTRIYGDKCPSHAVVGPRVGRGGSRLLDLMRVLFANSDIPHQYLTASRADRLQLLAGLLDSDGYLHEGNVEIAQKNVAIADGVCFLARSLGFRVTRATKVVNGESYQRMYIIGDHSVVPNRIARKKASPRLINKDPLRTGFSIHPLGDGAYYGFTLDGDGRFLLGDFTVTHNTQVFSSVAEHFLGPGQRVLLLAHRKELVRQGADRLQLVTGEVVDTEMAEEWASNRARVVAASLDSLRTRLSRWPSDHFSLVIFDEVHHSLAKSFRKVVEHFTCKRLGVTATPDRGDEKALGQLWGDVAYVRDIVDGIDDGYLVPIKGRSVRIDEINLSTIGKTAGDLAQGELDEEMVKHIEGIVSKTLELEPNRRGIWFFPGVQSAELASHRIQAMGQTCAFVCGETPKEERDELFRGFRNGTYQHLSNCQVATEGFDAPSADMVVIGRPTLSRALFAQMVGRGLRVLPGLSGGSAAERRSVVSGSDKPNCVVVDFAGNAGKHSLITPEDLLGGDYSEEEVKLAKKVAKEQPESDALANLAAARRELKAMMAKLQSKVRATVNSFDPFSILHMRAPEAGQERFREEASRQQLEMLSTMYKVKEARLRGLSKLEAQKLIGTLKTRRNLGLASLNQVAVLQKHGIDQVNVPFRKASKMIDYIASTGWNPDRGVLQGMLK